MRNPLPVPRNGARTVPSFTPVPRTRARHDGWTAQRQRDFIAALAATGSVTAAAQTVNMAPEGAYALRRDPRAAEFDAAWAAALHQGIDRLEDIAVDRAIHGVEVPVYSYGKLIGTRRVHNDRLLMFILRHRRAEAWGLMVPLNALRPGAPTYERLRAEWEASAAAEDEQDHNGIEPIDDLLARLRLSIETVKANRQRSEAAEAEAPEDAAARGATEPDDAEPDAAAAPPAPLEQATSQQAQAQSRATTTARAAASADDTLWAAAQSSEADWADAEHNAIRATAAREASWAKEDERAKKLAKMRAVAMSWKG